MTLCFDNLVCGQIVFGELIVASLSQSIAAVLPGSCQPANTHQYNLARKVMGQMTLLRDIQAH
jgi:hypothetical protein